MKNQRQTFLTRQDFGFSFDSIAWAFQVHVKCPDKRALNFAILYGNEDAPERIEFFVENEHGRKPDFVWCDPGGDSHG